MHVKKNIGHIFYVVFKVIPYFSKSCLNAINSPFAYCVTLRKEGFFLKIKEKSN